MRCRPIPTLLLLALPATLLAQSPGELAARERERRARQKQPPAKSYTNDDLAKAGGGPAAEPPPADSGPPAASPAGSQDAAEADWRERAAKARAAVASAEQKAAALQARIEALRVDLNPTEAALDPFREQTRQAQLAELQRLLDESHKSVASARQDLEDLAEEARRSNVPPGWLREP